MFHVVSCGQRGNRDNLSRFVGPAWLSAYFIWFRVPYVVLEMFHAVSRGQHVLALFQLVSCGQRGTPDVSYGTWSRVASVVYSSFVVWFRGQCVTRDVSCGFVWPVWYSRCFMWFRVANVAVDMLHVVPCGQRGCGFVWPVWNTRCCMLFRVACVVFEMFHGFVLPAWSAT